MDQDVVENKVSVGADASVDLTTKNDEDGVMGGPERLLGDILLSNLKEWRKSEEYLVKRTQMELKREQQREDRILEMDKIKNTLVSSIMDKGDISPFAFINSVEVEKWIVQHMSGKSVFDKDVIDDFITFFEKNGIDVCYENSAGYSRARIRAYLPDNALDTD